MSRTNDPDAYRGWISDENLEWFNAWHPDRPDVPFEQWLAWFRERIPNLGDIREFRVRRGADPETWIFQVGYIADDGAQS